MIVGDKKKFLSCLLTLKVCHSIACLLWSKGLQQDSDPGIRSSNPSCVSYFQHYFGKMSEGPSGSQQVLIFVISSVGQ